MASPTHQALSLAAAGREPVRAARRRRPQAWAGLLFVLPSLIFLAVFVAYPVIDAVHLSFVSVDFATDERRFVGLANFAQMLRDPKFGTVLWNTLVWTVGSLAGQFALGLGAALAINRDLPGMKLIRTVLLLPYVVPVIAIALFWRWMLDGTYGIVSNLLQSMHLLTPGQSPLAEPGPAMVSVIFANIWRGFPFVMISYWAALQDVPQEQYEAARVDGAGPWQEFRFVTLPHLAAVTRVMLVLRLIWTVTFFDVIYLITKGGPGGATEHWPIWIYEESMGFFRFGYAAALALTLALVLAALSGAYLLLVRRSLAQ
jgi:multiple sugar transport system permease protein